MFTSRPKYGILVYIILGVIEIEILKISIGDVLELKKPHPCGNKLFKIMRVGSDVRVVCLKCGRDLTMDRIKFEKAVKSCHKITNEVLNETN